MTPYKDYTGRVVFDDEALVFRGRVEGIQAVVTFEGATAEEVLRAFRESVDDYLAWAAEDGFEPERAFTGELSVTVSPDQHRMVQEAADAARLPLEGWLRDAVLRAAEGMALRRAG